MFKLFSISIQNIPGWAWPLVILGGGVYLYFYGLSVLNNLKPEPSPQVTKPAPQLSPSQSPQVTGGINPRAVFTRTVNHAPGYIPNVAEIKSSCSPHHTAARRWVNNVTIEYVCILASEAGRLCPRGGGITYKADDSNRIIGYRCTD
jgi:hypothetical protein